MLFTFGSSLFIRAMQCAFDFLLKFSPTGSVHRGNDSDYVSYGKLGTQTVRHDGESAENQVSLKVFLSPSNVNR